MPIDVVKVRLQYQGADGVKVYRGLADAFISTARNEGMSALYKGLSPALVRQVDEEEERRRRKEEERDEEMNKDSDGHDFAEEILHSTGHG